MAGKVDWTAAEIAREKFTRYSMDPTNPSGRRKWEAFVALGYIVADPANRGKAADDVLRQLQATMPPDPPPPISRFTDHGDRYETTHEIEGPNGRKGQLEVVWQVDPGATHPRLVTNFLRVHKEPSR